MRGGWSNPVTYVPSDLQRRYRTILDEAKAGEARVRDSDGTTILLLPEADVQAFRQISSAASNLARVERVAEAMVTRRPALAEYGDWRWLHVFDADDLREFIREVREAIIVGAREGSTALLDEQLHAWQITGRQADDPLFRTILTGGAVEEDFVEVRRPEAAAPAQGDHVDASAEDGVE